MSTAPDILERVRPRAAQTAFAIPELLEIILSHSTTRDLLLFQRTSKIWLRTIHRSKHLLQKLYLSAVPPSTTWLLDDRSMALIKGLSSPPATLPYDGCKTILQGTFNPLIIRRGYFDIYPPFALRLRLGECVVVINPHDGISRSGRMMFLTQPPCTELKLWTDFTNPTTIKNAKGLRVEDLWHVTEGHPVVPYLPEMFVQLAGFIEPSEMEMQGEVKGRLARGGWEGKDGPIASTEVTG